MIEDGKDTEVGIFIGFPAELVGITLTDGVIEGDVVVWEEEDEE